MKSRCDMIKGLSLSQNILHFVIAILLIILFVVSALGGYLYYFCYRTVYSDFLTDNMQQLTAVAERHENDMQIMDDIVSQIGFSDDITRFLLVEKPDKGNELKNRLKHYTLISQFFSMALYQYHEDEYIFNATSSVSTNYFVEKGCVFEKTNPEEIKELLYSKDEDLYILPERNGSGAWMSSYMQEGNIVLFFKTILPEREETMVFFVPGKYYDNLMRSEEEERTFFLYFDEQIVVYRGNALCSKEELCNLLLKQFAENIVQNSTIQEKVYVNGQEYLLSLKKGNSGISYGSLQATSVFRDKMLLEQWIILLLIVGSLIIVMPLIVMLFGRIVKWVRRLNFVLHDEASYDLESIEEGIRSLINNEETSKIENQTYKCSTFIRNFIRGDYESRQIAIDAAYEAGLNIDYQKFIVMVIRNKEENTENRLFSDILTLLKQTESVQGYGIHLIGNNQNVFVIFGDSESIIKTVLDEILEIEKANCRDYIIAISNYHTDFKDSAKAYLEADMAFDNHLLLDNSRIICFSEISNLDYGNFSAEKYLKHLQFVIQQGDMAGAEKVINSICNKLKSTTASLYSFRIFYLDLIHVLLAEWGDGELPIECFYDVFTLSQCMNVQDFYELLCEICMLIIDRNVGNKKQEHDIVNEAIAYMKENYHMPDLTMNVLADYLGISSVVLSVEFRKVMDIKPSDYLGNLRMEKSKELLCNTNMLIREVSLAVGYEDEHVFIRRFKKHMGVTPKQFRLEYLEKSE